MKNLKRTYLFIIHHLSIFVKSTAIITLSLLLSSPASARIPDEGTLDFFSENGIYYYNPDGYDECVSTSTTLTGNGAVEKAWNFFVSQGFNDAQTAGILGNAQAESSFVITRSSSGSYWGFFQWGGGRKTRLEAKIKDAGLEKYLSSSYWESDSNIPEADFNQLLQIELEHTMSETDHDWQNELKKANTPEEAAEIFLVLFERAVNGDSPILHYAPYSGLLYQGSAKRRDFASNLYAQYASNNPTTTNLDGSNITLIGDSISEGSTNAIREQFPNIHTLDALSGRTFNEGIEIAKNLELQEIVIFALGANSSSLTTNDINNVLDVLQSARKIIFVTNYGPNGYTNNNTLFKDAAKNNLKVSIADWEKLVSEDTNKYLNSDLIHPSAEGQSAFAKLLAQTAGNDINSNGCNVNGELSELVLAYAWPDYHKAPYTDRMPAYAEAVSVSRREGRYVGGSVNGVPGIDCGGFVTILVQNSGLEPTYNTGSDGTGIAGNTPYQEKWILEHNWTLLNQTANTPIDTSVLQAGDVAFYGNSSHYSNNKHTFIYVGSIPGFNSVIASAAYGSSGTGGRAPMAGKEDLIYGGGGIVRWYRKN